MSYTEAELGAADSVSLGGGGRTEQPITRHRRLAHFVDLHPGRGLQQDVTLHERGNVASRQL